jgi:hypothetical protein
MQCSAQTRLTTGKIKGKHATFIVYQLQSSLMMDTIKRIGVDSKNNKYNNGIPYSKAEKDRRFLPMNPKKDIHINNDAIKQIILGVLGNKLDAMKRNKEEMSLILKFEPDGKLTDIGFTLHENTLISIQNIEEIDHQLRASIKATFTGKQYLQYIAINYYPPLIIF